MNQLGTDKFKKKFYEVFGKEDYRYIKNKTYADLKQNPAGQKTIMVFSPTLTDLGRRIFNHIKYEQEKERRNDRNKCDCRDWNFFVCGVERK